MRLAFIVSHPIQYYVPIYREVAKQGEIFAKVFFTWRDGGPARDAGFGKEFAWDIPLMDGYDFELVPNTSRDPGTHHRRGLINPNLVDRVMAWRPDAVHITGFNYVSHGQAIKQLSRAGIPVFFRGDSHLLDPRGGWWRWWLKKWFLSRVYSRPAAFLSVGQANRAYYRAFGVPARKLFHVPHTIEVSRFAEPNDSLESEALGWRRELKVPDDHFVFLYAAKLEPRKRPMELLETFFAADFAKTSLVFAGSGALEGPLKKRAEERTAETSKRVIFLPFQNQSAMPVVYRLADALVLPSGYGETWGLAVNEAQACGRPALVSDCVGCAGEIIREGENGAIFRTDDWTDCARAMQRMMSIDWFRRREEIRARAWCFDTTAGVQALVDVLRRLSPTT